MVALLHIEWTNRITFGFNHPNEMEETAIKMPTGLNLVELVNLGFVTRIDPGADGRVLFALASAKPIALNRWLEALDAQGIFVEQISIRPNSDATLAVDATLRARTK